MNATAGRDHWPDCYSVVLAGGGIAGGSTLGESDSMGAYPAFGQRGLRDLDESQ